ncbi:hypothetical protein [Nostoc sp.]|uniref:hypothetical protein n=1 Tax=Nostoc sp. TaxID=1180 RepID=UPI002FF63003
MAVRQDTIWERFLSPVVRLLIDEDGLRLYADSGLMMFLKSHIFVSMLLVV